MTTLSRSAFPAVGLAIMLAIVGCSDDENPAGNGGGDTTAPSVSSVTAVDAFHIEVAFSENLQRASAEQEENYLIIEDAVLLASSAAPGDTLHVASAALDSDQRTVLLTTAGTMDTGPYDLTITGVADVNGNEISTPVATEFNGTTDPDVTAPAIVARSPNPNATGVGVGVPVTIRFSEPLDMPSFASGVTWAVAGGGAAVPFDIQYYGGTEYVLAQLEALNNLTQYTVTLTGVEDLFGNAMATTSWSFSTTNIVDTTPPTLVSSVPANGATSVDVNTNISLTFSEAISQTELLIQAIPDPGDGTATWTNGGKTLTFDPDLPLLVDQQYNLTILPGGVRDLSGNGILLPVAIVFSTGNALATGSFAGTLTGDPGSTTASDPTGALVVAADQFPFENDEFNILGTDVVAPNNTYDIRNLPDGVYYPIAVMNTNGDNELDPSTGDAIGAFGADIGSGDFEPDSLTIVGGNRVTGVNFPLFDPSGITGTVVYYGAYAAGSYPLWIGVFDANNFDPTEPPLYGTTASWPDFPEWRINSLDDGLADGQYYVAAFLDVNGNSTYDPAVDPAGIHGAPTVISIQDGSDAVDLSILLDDPLASADASVSVVWPAPANRAPWLGRLSAAVRQAQLGAASRSTLPDAKNSPLIGAKSAP